MVSGVEVGDIRVLDQPLSDHRAVTASFALNPAASSLGASADAQPLPAHDAVIGGSRSR
jgi:hypothetical protein